MNFDDYTVNEYEEVLPQDKEFKNWMDSIERDYDTEVSTIDADEVTEIRSEFEEEVNLE